MTTADLAPYEQCVESASSALGAFRLRLLKELDQRDGAFRWWRDFSDWKTLNMIADYLIQSLAGASEALVSASFAAQCHREAATNHSEMCNAAWRRVAATGETDPRVYIEAIPNDAATRRIDCALPSLPNSAASISVRHWIALRRR